MTALKIIGTIFIVLAYLSLFIWVVDSPEISESDTEEEAEYWKAKHRESKK